MFRLCLHLSLNRICWVADEDISGTIEEARAERVHRLLLPGCPLLIMSHYYSNLINNFKNI